MLERTIEALSSAARWYLTQSREEAMPLLMSATLLAPLIAR
jgi:hypothetical protein